MNRRTTIAALILVGAASFAAAPSYAQTSNALMDAKIPSEKAAAPKAGVAPRVSPLAGATSAEQIAANVAAVDWQLSDDELAEVDAILAAHRK